MPRVLRAPSPPRTPKNVSIQTPARSQATDDQAVPTTSGDAPDSSSGFGGDVYEQVTVFAHMSAAILLTVAEITCAGQRLRMVATEQIICRCFVNTIFACGCTRVVLTGNGGCRSCAADRRASNAQCNHPPGHPAAVSAHVWQCESAPPYDMVGASGVLSGCRCIWNAPPPQQSVVRGICELGSSPDHTGRAVLASAVYMVRRPMLENVSL